MIKKISAFSVMKYAALLVFLLFTSCKSIQIGNKTGVLRSYKSHKLIEEVIDKQPEFSKIQVGKFNARFVLGDKKFSSGGSVNYVEDSLFVLSVQPILGIELFRVEITKEYIMVLDKLNRRYVKESIADLTAQFGTEMPKITLDGILKNQLFAIGNDDFFEKKHDAKIAVNELDKSYHIQFVANDINHEFTVDNVHFGIDKVKLSKAGDDDFVALSYNAKQQVNAIVFPTLLLFEIVSSDFTASCELKLSGISINDKINAKTINLSRFNKMTVEELMKSFTK